MKDKEFNRYREEENEEKQDTELVTECDCQEANEECKSANDNEELKKAQASYLRVLADFENFKKRTNEERIKERKYAHQSLFEQLVNSLDIFDKAVNMKTEDEKINNFLIGFKMINDNFKQILESEGVKKINAVGEKFDPNFHHAMEVEWDESKAENTVLSELQTGYMYKDRLLRPSLVKVNQKKKGNENNE